MSPESSPHPENNLQERLISSANIINSWVQGRRQRGSHEKTTQIKLMRKIGELALEFQGTAAYMRLPFMIMPLENGNEILSFGEVTGEIVGFAYREYPTLTERMEQGPSREGTVAIVATGGTNIEGVTPASWNQVIPEVARAAMPMSDDYTQKGVVPVLAPIVEGARFTQVDNRLPLHLNPSHVLRAEFADSPKRDYLEYVRRIENLMKGKYILRPEMDRPIMSALHNVLSSMNADCPLLGQSVEISAAYMQTPSPSMPDEYTVLEGDVTGTLRKFIYAPYFPDDSHPHLRQRGAVQAVVYKPDVAERVYRGELSPQEADKMPGTIYMPLDQQHKLAAAN